MSFSVSPGSLKAAMVVALALASSSNVAGCGVAPDDPPPSPSPTSREDGVAKPVTFIDGIVVRSETLVYGNYDNNVNALIAGAKRIGAKKIYFEVRAVDANEPGQVGALYYDPVSPKITNEKIYTYKSVKFTNKNLAKIVTAAKKAKIEAHAWVSAFNNPVYFASHAAERNSPNDSKETFLSPACDAYGTALSTLIDDVVSTFDVDGIALDYTRYTDDRQPLDACARKAYEDKYPGGDIAKDSAKPGPARDRFLNYRASLITDLYSDTATRLAKKGVSLSGFLTPWSAKFVKVGGPSAYFASSINGVDYEKLVNLPIKILPMIYWTQVHADGTKTTQWEDGFPNWQSYAKAVNNNVGNWVSGKRAKFAPVYSLEKTNAELVEAMNISRAEGVYGVTLFWSGEWDRAESKTPNAFDRVVKILDAVN